MKLVVIHIEYNKEVGEGEFDDIISITCPFKQYSVSLQRADIDNFTLADIVEEKEYEHFKQRNMYYGYPIKFTTKIKDSDYNILFQDCVDYTPEKRNNDLSSMFTWLKWKVSQIYHDSELYKKYVDIKVDVHGDMDGCTFCEFLHSNNFCTKTNKISPQKACPRFKFKKNKKL